MLDEVVGFNEQGFSLYIMSFWNVFDLGILTLLFSYSCLRTVSALVGDAGQKAALAAQAYDVLAASAVLLLPRLFSVLDHVRYFSQLLIAFRMMAADLLAISILIVICCSGFFVAFTFAFNELDETPGEVVYDLFQMLMGFTPTAWAIWDRNSFAGRLILVCFMFISHFLVVTILVTVLTNSFMAVVQNADEEHQFLFAVNTISMVKSDALFAYIAPTNVLAWIVAPLRYLMPFREFLKLNRLIIKTTHFPVLFSIYIYERFFLARSTIGYVADDFYDDDDDHQTIGRAASRAHASRNRTFGRLVREPSVATFRKDQALAEVFRHPLKGDDSRSVRSPMLHGLGVDLHHRGSRSNAVKVDSWMETLPEENSSGVREFNDHEQTVTVRAKARRKAAKHPDWSAGGLRVPSRSYGTLRHRGDASLSVASDPEDRLSSHVLTFGAVRGRTTLAVPARASRLPIQRPARRSRLPPDVDDDAQHEGDNEEEDQPHEGMSDDEDEDDEGDGTDEEDEDEDEVQGAAHDSDGSSTEDEGAGGGTGYLKAGDGGKQDDDNTGPRTATASRHALHQHATSAAALRRPLATSHRRAHHSSEDEQGTEDLATRRLVRAGVAKRGSRSATTPPTSRHSTRPPTPRRTSRAAGLRPAKRELRQMTHASAPHGSHEGSVSNADETAGESADSEAAVMMRTPPRNSGTADPELIDFARRQASRPSAQRQGRERLGPLAAMRTTPDTPPVHQRPRSGSVTSATGAWADDGQSTTVLPSRRPGLSRAESHPVRSSALTPVAGMPLAIDIASDLGDNKAIGGGLVGAIPSSFATQMAYATGGLRREPSIERNTSTQDLLSRLVLARMKTLEEGFQQVVREVKDLKLRDEREDRRERERDREREWERRTTQRSPATANPQIRTVPKLSGVRLSSTGPSQRRRPAAGVSKVKDKFRALPQAGSARSNNRRSGSSTAHASTGVDTATSSDARAPVLLALEQEQEGGPEPQVNGGGGIKPGPAYDLGTSALGRGEADQEHRFTVEPQAQPQD
ncbi:hypothetical protein KEM52_001208 [Ascosphaera acerosa]|nr:hypothetical protein KEM52_001208 [Ascosphaera acerosa]